MTAGINYNFSYTSSLCKILVPGASMCRVRNAAEFYQIAMYRNINAFTTFWVDSFRVPPTHEYFWGDGTPVNLAYFCNGQPDSCK